MYKGYIILSKIILLNAGKYQKAVITFDTDSIQIVGKNNVGKTSLLSVLNFLYIPNKNEWNFDHDAKTTLNYYFQKLDKHYIIFEIYKNSYFCILIRRNDNNELEYSFIDTAYDEVEKDFFSTNNALLSFEDVSANLLSKIKKLSRKEFTELVFGTTRRDKSVIWLSDGSSQKRFSKIYKYLLNTKLITNQKVKESLLIADKKDREQREFSSADSKQIEDIKKHQRDIASLFAVKKEFLIFQELVCEYDAKVQQIHGFYHAFKKLYEVEELELKNTSLTIENEITMIKEEEEQPLRNEKNSLSEAIGSVKTDLSYKKQAVTQQGNAIAEIERYDPLNFLELAFSDLEKKKKKLDYALTLIENEGYTQEKIATLVKTTKKEISTFTNSIENFENLLIHHISDNEETKRILNMILSDEVLKLDKDSIKSVVTKISKESLLEVFDGKIDIKSIEEQEFTTIEVLKNELVKKELLLSKFEQIAINIENLHKLEDEVKELSLALKETGTKIDKLKELPQLEKALKLLDEEYANLLEKEKGILNKQKVNGLNFEEVTKRLKGKSQELSQKKDRIDLIGKYYISFEDELKSLSLDFEPYTGEKSLDNISVEIRLLRNTIYPLKNKKDTLFSKLKERLQKEHADEQSFIRETEEDLNAIDDKEKAINEIINSIANNISQPTKEFLKQLDYFESYVKTVSRKFKKYKISDLNSVEVVMVRNTSLIHDLNLISQIDRTALFNAVEDLDYNEQLNILKKYITESKKIMLSDLFDIRFLINNKSVNISKQTESNGTDRILKITLFLVIMQDLFVQDDENKLVIYVDELGEVDDDNIKGFINRCKENNFIPIFAGPDKKPNIDKYYDLLALKNKQIVVDESRAIHVKNRV